MFLSHRGSQLAIAVLGVTVLIEIFTATFNLLLLLAHGTSWPFVEFVISGYPRILLLLVCSYLTYPPRWYTQWLKIDICFIGWVCPIWQLLHCILRRSFERSFIEGFYFDR